MDIVDIADWLEEQGWRSGKVSEIDMCDRVWYRWEDVEPKCYCNSNKPGIQVTLKGWDLSEFNPDTYWLFEVTIKGECDDEEWVTLQANSIPWDKIQVMLKQQIAKLVRAWKACQTGTNRCSYDRK